MHPLPECLWATVKIFLKRMKIQLSGDADAAPASRPRAVPAGWMGAQTWEVLQAGRGLRLPYTRGRAGPCQGPLSSSPPPARPHPARVPPTVVLGLGLVSVMRPGRDAIISEAAKVEACRKKIWITLFISGLYFILASYSALS